VSVHPLASVLAGLARLVSGANARWLDCEPSLRQRVYFANHTSHLDFVVLWASLPPELRARTRPVAARDYWEKGRLRRLLAQDVFRAVLIEREFARATPGEGMTAARSLMDRLVDALGEESSLILFPEGTRGSGEQVGAFRNGLYHLCRRKPGLELVPVYMENLNRILPKGEVLPVPLLSSVTFGPPMQLQPAEDKRKFLERARQALVKLRPE
jgi:1-acyl-sn-glycerol-3-phosphate acyltransferase